MSSFKRLVIIIAVLACARIMVLVIRRFSEKYLSARLSASFSKVKSFVSLVSSIIVFILNFATFGLVLKEFGGSFAE